MNEGMIRNIITRIKGGNPNPVAITKPSSYKPPVPSPHVAAAQAKVDADYKARVKAGTPAARTERMKARIAAMKEEALQIDEVGDTFVGRLKLRAVAKRAKNADINKEKDKRYNTKTNVTNISFTIGKGSDYKVSRSMTRQETGAAYRTGGVLDDTKERLKNVVNAAKERIKNKGTNVSAIKTRNAAADAEQANQDSASADYGRDRLGKLSRDELVTKYSKVKPIRPGKFGVSQRNTFRGKVPAANEEVEQIDEVSTGKKLHAAVVRVGKGTKAAVVHTLTTPGAALSGFPGKNKVSGLGKEILKHHRKSGSATVHNVKKGVKNLIRALPEDVEQIDEAGPQKKATRLHNKLRDAVRGARYKQTGMPVFEPEAQHKTPQAYNKAIGRALRGMGEEVEQVDETNARHSFTATQQVLTPTKKRILDASSNNPRAKADAKKYEIRASKFSGWSKEEIRAHLRSMRDEVNEGAEYIEERLKASDPTSKWISDFVHSDNPRFKGKTRKERINMALGAYYAKKKGVSEAKLDPVGQEDADVNNDGIKGHSTDKYLMKRRAAISQAIKNKK